MAATTYEPLTAYIVVAIYYLVIVLALTALVSWLEHRLSAHRRPESDTQVRQPEQEGVKP
jgi:polar amino acid transport system permease protein